MGTRDRVPTTRMWMGSAGGAWVGRARRTASGMVGAGVVWLGGGALWPPGGWGMDWPCAAHRIGYGRGGGGVAGWWGLVAARRAICPGRGHTIPRVATLVVAPTITR
jgi:hypothetical protein